MLNYNFANKVSLSFDVRIVQSVFSGVKLFQRAVTCHLGMLSTDTKPAQGVYLTSVCLLLDVIEVGWISVGSRRNVAAVSPSAQTQTSSFFTLLFSSSSSTTPLFCLSITHCRQRHACAKLNMKQSPSLSGYHLNMVKYRFFLFFVGKNPV